MEDAIYSLEILKHHRNLDLHSISNEQSQFQPLPAKQQTSSFQCQQHLVLPSLNAFVWVFVSRIDSLTKVSGGYPQSCPAIGWSKT
jgi:hypothetical protein